MIVFAENLYLFEKKVLNEILHLSSYSYVEKKVNHFLYSI